MAAGDGASRICVGCGATSPDGNRYCGACGAELPATCPGCGHGNPPGNRFCGGCGAAIAPPSPEPAPNADASPEPPNPEPAPETPPAPAPPPPIPEPSPLAEGMDAVARERELNNLLAKANLLRLRAQIRDARRTLDIALEVASTLHRSATAPVHELIGDMLAAEERWDAARDAYALANDADPTRASVERKLGAMILKARDEAALGRLGLSAEPEIDLEDVQNRLAVATAISLIAPGAGHLLLRQWAKGAVFLACFLAASGFFLASKQTVEIAGPGRRARNAQTRTVGTGYATVIVAVGIYVASLLDLAAQSKRNQARKRPNPVPAGDPADWEV
ncbi:MAG: DUF6677 family protein [Armatimonadota bacterium]